MNKEWHAKNKMPAKATLEQRIDWHLRHRENCGCGEVPKSLLKEVNSEKTRQARASLSAP